MSADMSSYCSAHDEWLIMKLCMYTPVCLLHMRDEAIHYKLYLLKLTMAVDNIVFRILKRHVNVHIIHSLSLMYMCFCTIPSNGHTSLSTSLVLFLAGQELMRCRNARFGTRLDDCLLSVGPLVGHSNCLERRQLQHGDLSHRRRATEPTRVIGYM